jgi:AraC-like DNA-binding protein
MQNNILMTADFGSGGATTGGNDAPGEGVQTTELVTQLVSDLLSQGCVPSVRDVAGVLGSSLRTLQRRLSAQGHSFSGLVRQVRVEEASSLLQDPEKRVIDVAFEVGYDDSSHFSRAFLEVTGVSPIQYRSAWRPASPTRPEASHQAAG